MTSFVSTGRRRELGATLRKMREDAGFNGLEMAQKMHCSPAKLSRAENGKGPLAAADVILYAGLCGVAGERLQELLKLVDEPDFFRIKSHPDQVPDELLTLMSYESNAKAIDAVAPVLLPGMLQTPEYAREVIRALGDFDEAGVELRAKIREDRKDVLTRRKPVRCSLIVHENALRSVVGGSQVMYEQMLHLLFAGGREQCSIRVVPASAGPAGLTHGPFWIYHYREDPPVVYVEHEITSDFLEDGRVVEAYQRVLDRVATVALSEAESRTMIAELASEYEQQGVTRHDDHAAGTAELAEE